MDQCGDNPQSGERETRSSQTETVTHFYTGVTETVTVTRTSTQHSAASWTWTPPPPPPPILPENSTNSEKILVLMILEIEAFGDFGDRRIWSANLRGEN